jgi:hypothetical protein
MEHPMKRVTILLPLLLILSLLQGCHGSSAITTSTVRMVNGDVSTLDMYWTGSGTAAPVASGVAFGAASTGFDINGGDQSVGVVYSGGPVPSGTPYSFTGGYNYTMVAVPSYDPITGQETPVLKQLIDYQATMPVPGQGLLGVANYSGAGSLDVYVVANTGAATSPISSINKVWTGVSGTTSYNTVNTGSTSASYHIQVTGAGAGPNTDVRLDIPAAIIGNQQIMTLALTPTPGGVLVDGLLILEQGQNVISGSTQQVVTPFKNGSARIRIVASSNATTSVTATATGTVLGASLSPGSIGAYVPVPLFTNIAGLAAASPQSGVASAVALSSTIAQPVTLSVSPPPVSGGDTSCNTLSAMVGQDITLLVVPGATPQCYVINDNNTLAPAGFAKLRLVNGVNGLGSVTLAYDTTYTQSAASGVATSPVNVPVPSGSPYSLTLSPWTGSVNWETTPPLTLQQYGVYSVFLLGNLPVTSAASAVLNSDYAPPQ